MLGDAQRTAAEWVSEMHAAGHQEGKCVQIREKPAAQPSDVRNVEASSVCGTSAGSADTMRGFARDMARVQALKAELESLLFEDAEATGQSAAMKRKDKPLWQQKLDAKRMRIERIDKQEVQLREFKEELSSLNAACAEVLDAADIEGAEADREQIHTSVSDALLTFCAARGGGAGGLGGSQLWRCDDCRTDHRFCHAVQGRGNSSGTPGLAEGISGVPPFRPWLAGRVRQYEGK